MPAPETIHELVDRFHYNLNEYKNPKYNETQVRVEFINPFWQALGWDVNNHAGYAMAFRDVVHEDEVKVGGSTKAPDYSFRIGGRRIFFLEAKKPSRDLKHDPEPAFQLRRYAYSAKLPMSMITDFEELGIYDTRIKPAITDKSHVGRMTYYTYGDYIDKWDEINETFSKEAVMRGAFDRFVEDNTKKKGSAELDRDFLNSLDEWRVLLARNIALRNPQLSERELNFCVQKTIDRLIFLRMAEDRGIETYGTLQALQNGEQAYQRLVQIYYRADERYNSGLFHFEDKDGDYADTLTPGLQMDDKVLKEIIKNVYYPCPYEFSQLPVEVLGNAYEQFLGKRITLTGGHRAKIEEKPEVRKAGGVYYTPQYIVDYIVEHTVGELLKDKTPKQVSELRILDPACGSGSFLLGAYQYLLDWHLKYYHTEFEQSGTIPTVLPVAGQRPRKSDPQAIFQGAQEQWFLTTAEKKRILLNNIYGVDIDANAVEVTKLSLLLKVLENENSETLHHQLGLWQERALPNLSGNIKCGNSLIGPDYYDNQQSVLFDEEEMLRVNVFDWQQEFSDIFAQGGFDAVIGNPPYGATFQQTEIKYLVEKYGVFQKINDAYIAFMENSHSNLLKDGGHFGFIIPSAWLGGPKFLKLREMLLDTTIKQVIDLPFNVFKDAYIDTMVFLNSNRLCEKNDHVIAYNYPKKEKINKIDLSARDFSIFHQKEWEEVEDKKFVLEFQILKLLKTLQNRFEKTVSDFSLMRRGVLFDKKMLTLEKTSQNSHSYFEGDVYRYELNFVAPNWIEFGAKMKEYPRDFSWFENDRILLRRLVNRRRRLMATFVEGTFITNKNLYVLKATDEINILYLLGIINSKLISRLYLSKVSQATKDDFPQVTQKDILNLPFPSPSQIKHDRLVDLVQQMLDLHKTLSTAREPRTREQLQRRITATDNQIDRLVYELYELTEEEIKIVEGETS